MSIHFRTYFIILLILGALTPLYSQCFVDSVSIVPAVTVSEREVLIQVQGLSPSDLSSDQSLCRIFMEFEHGRVGNVRIKLKSPAGQEITLIGPGVTGGSLSPLVGWDIQLVPCLQPTLPDFGFDEIWNSDQNWASLTNYTGTYYPHSGCLQDFNMGSAEGTWTLTLENLGNTTGTLIYFAMTFCSGAPSDCVTCSAYPGEFNVQNLEFCQGVGTSQPVELVVPADLSSTDSLIYFISTDAGSGSFVSEIGDLAELPAGSATVCPVSLQSQDVNSVVAMVTDFAALQVLGDDTDNCLNIGNCIAVEVYPFQNTDEQAFLICAGDTLDYRGEKYTESVDSFIYEGTPSLPCTERIHLVVTVETVVADLDAVSTTLVCGQNALLDAGGSMSSTGPITEYAWSTIDGNFILDVGPIAQVDQAGTYVVELGTANCTVLDSIILTSEDTFFILLEQEPALCLGDQMVIMVMDSIPPNGSATNFDIASVAGPDADPVINMDGSVTVSEPGTYDITTTAGSCSVVNQIIVTPPVVPAYDLELSADTMTCLNTSVALEWMTDIPNPQAAFSGPEIIPVGTIDPVISTPGLYYIVVIDDNQCSYVDSVEVVRNEEAPVLSLDDQEFDCSVGLSDRILMSSVTGQVESYAWTGPMFSSSEAEPAITDPGSYTLIVTGINGCTATEEMEVTFTSRDFDFEVDDLLLPCDLDSIRICAHNFEIPIQSAIWSQQTDSGLVTVSMDTCFYLKSSSTYTLELESESGCSLSQNFVGVDYAILHRVELSASAFEFWCDDTSIDLRAMPFGPGVLTPIINWSRDGMPLAQFDGEIFITIEAPGFYEVLMSFGNPACLAIDTITITGDPDSSIAVDLGPDLQGMVGESILLNAVLDPVYTDQTLIWQPADILSCNDCLDPVLILEEDTEISLTVIDNQGCTAMDTLKIVASQVETIATDSLIYFPTHVLTGNEGDDRFMIGMDTTLVDYVEIQIYDRWGNVMAEISESNPGPTLDIWDGRRNGQPVETGVYVYMAKYLQVNGLEKVSVGTFTLIR